MFLFVWIFFHFILEFNFFTQAFNHCRSPKGMSHGCYLAQIHGILANKTKIKEEPVQWVTKYIMTKQNVLRPVWKRSSYQPFLFCTDPLLSRWCLQVQTFTCSAVQSNWVCRTLWTGIPELIWVSFSRAMMHSFALCFTCTVDSSRRYEHQDMKHWHV